MSGLPVVAVLGRPNVGKSSLVNRLCGEEAVVVSDVPGTTRDSTDTRVERGGQLYIFVDTAGLRGDHSFLEARQVFHARIRRLVLLYV